MRAVKRVGAYRDRSVRAVRFPGKADPRALDALNATAENDTGCVYATKTLNGHWLLSAQS